MADYEKDILFAIQNAKTGHLLNENLPSDPISQAVYMEAFECYQDADVLFQEKCDELVFHEPNKEDFEECSPNKQENFVKVAKHAAHEYLRERMVQREGNASHEYMKLQQQLQAFKELESIVRIKEGIMRAASARMLASMSITREKEAGISELDFEQAGYDSNTAHVEYNVAKQMQQIAQKQAITAVMEFVKAMEEYQSLQEKVIPYERQCKKAHIIAYTAKYVAENAQFSQKPSA
mmetsp:Transcript_5540/g.5721  ORF Transcript_5540/g.5721 Transcript_5540/m.5721 type:complete len:236 (+) Transcript_5540:2-709(+)